MLSRLTAAGASWLAVAPQAAVIPPGVTATVIDVCQPGEAPPTIDPFEPAPGYPVQVHIELLAALLEAAYHPPGPVRAAIRLALQRVYTDHGWDLVAGGALLGAVAPPGIPPFAELRHAAAVAVADLGCDTAARAAVRAFLDVTLMPLWTGQAGRFLADGHPADVGALPCCNTIFVTGGIAASEAVTFLTGVFLLRLAGHLRLRGPEAGRLTVVVAIPPSRLRRVLDEVRTAGADVMLARPDNDRDACQPPANSHSHGRPQDVVPLLGRRSVACGLQCRQRPCTGYELHDADLRAAADSQVWLRLWVQALVLAFITGRPLPHVPQPLRQAWRHAPHQPNDARTRECLLATVIDRAVGSRALALRHSYQPERLVAAVASVAAGQLATASPATATAGPTTGTAGPVTGTAGPVTATGSGSAVMPPRAGHFWVIPQLRWLHEAERLRPLAQHQPRPDDIAPPLEFGLTGLVDWPGISVGDRLASLYRHRLSMEHEHNRALATIALLGTEPERDVAKDLVIVGIGRDQPERLRYTARMLGTAGHGSAPGWLEVVLSWPDRLTATREPDLYQAATG